MADNESKNILAQYKQEHIIAQFKVQLNQFDNPLLSIDNHEKEVREEVLEEIKASPYIEEAYKIILDYILFLKSKQK